MYVGVVVYDGLEQVSGGYRYDRKLVEYLREQGDAVDVVEIPRENPTLTSSSRELRRRLNRPVDALVQDELCRPALVGLNRHLDRPAALVSLVHLLDSAVRKESGAALGDERRYLSTVDGALCTSRDTRERVAGLADVPTAVAYPGGRVEGAALSPDVVRARAHEVPFRVVFLGSVVERKGPSTLVEALGELEVPWRATVVGRLDVEPGYADRVRTLIEEYGLDDRVTIRGVVPDADLERLLERSHVLALPSRYESFGMAVLEGMEYGVVPVTTDRGGPPEFVEDGTNGLLVDPGNPGNVRGALAALAEDRERLASLATAALETAERHPSWEHSMGRARTFLRECRR